MAPVMKAVRIVIRQGLRVERSDGQLAIRLTAVLTEGCFAR